MKTFGKILLLVIMLGVLALLCWATVLYMAWPLWVALAMFCGVLGAYFLFKFLRRWWIVMRSRSKMAQQSMVSPESLLRKKWKAAVATLRASSLRRRGNALYVLPWFMVIGKSGTGKTTALTRARLSSPIQKLSQHAAPEQTENYDWWYFDQAVVIDSAGRYVDAQDTESDRREWELGLDMLARYRPREGLDGLVLAISTDRLGTLDKDGLVEEGRVVRARIEQLIQMFGKRFPIYILVTKCDQLYGLEEWARQLPEQALEQAMGYLSDDIDIRHGETTFLDSAFASIGERLQQLRIALVGRAGVADYPDAPGVGAELLLLPNELQNLRPRLEIFLHACLADNPYLERPFLRGLFFSSGLQQGGAVSNVMGALLPPLPLHAQSNAGLFLHDFFDRILPQDRYISRPAALLNRFRQITQNIGVAAWLLISIAAAILMGVAFIGNMHTLAMVRDERPFNPPLSGTFDSFGSNVPALVRVNDTLLQVEQRNAKWQNRWMVAATNIENLDATLKQHYVNDFRKHILPLITADSWQDFARVQSSDPDQEMPDMIRSLTREINLQKARQRGAGRSDLQKMPPLLPTARYTLQLNLQLHQLRLSYLAWMPAHDPFLSERLVADQALLDNVAYHHAQMRWLVGLVPTHGVGGSAEVTEADFWGGSIAADQADLNRVPATYTRAGQQQIEAFLDEMQKAVNDVPKFVERRAVFEAWYRDQRILAWQKFVANFTGAEHYLQGEVAWRTTLGHITGAQSPYSRVLDRLNEEFRDEVDRDLPSWLQLARQLQQLRVQASRVGLGGAVVGKAVRMVDAVNAVGGKAVKQTLVGEPASGGRMVRNNLSAVDTLAKYQDEINKMAAVAVSGTAAAYQLAAEFHQFGIEPGAKPSAAYIATNTLVQLKQRVGYLDAADHAVWRLIEGPLNFTMRYIEQQTSCELQKNWQAQVEWPLQTAPDKAAIIDKLYGAKGAVWAFADGIAKPFLERDARRFHVISTLGYSVPFTTTFLPMLNAAVDKHVAQLVTQKTQDLDQQTEQLQAQQTRTQQEQRLAELPQKSATAKALVTQLRITAQPTGVNDDAKAKPFETVLTVQCAAGAHQLNNFNFPVSISFPWIVGQCGEVSLQIKIGKLVVTKKYPGPMGVPNFLRDFPAGAQQFDASSFPAFRQELDALGVQQLMVRYSIEGQDAIIAQAQLIESIDKQQKDIEQALQQLPTVPDNIAQKMAAQPHRAGLPSPPELFLPQQIGVCWDQNVIKERSQNMQSMINRLVDKQTPSQMTR